MAFCLNVGHCQGDPFKVPPNSLLKANLEGNRLGVQTLGLGILSNCLSQSRIPLTKIARINKSWLMLIKYDMELLFHKWIDT